MSIAVDPLFHHESESLQESKIANLQLYTLDAFSGCDVQPTSDTIPSALYTQPEAKPVSPGSTLRGLSRTGWSWRSSRRRRLL